MRRLLRRLASSLLLMIAVSILTFVLAELAPGDFLAEMQLDPRISEETLETLRARYGLDQPLPVRYVRWLDSIVSGDLGHSFAHNMPVGPLLWPRAINTLLLTASAMLLSWLLAVPLGAWAAARRGGWLDRSSLGITAVLMAVPELLLGLGCLMLAVTSGWFPVGGMSSLDSATLGFWHRLGDLLRHLALPSLALTLASLPVLFRHVRSAMIDALATPHIQAARGHGIGLRRLLFHHALPTAAGPLTQLFGLSIASLLSGALLIEVIMSWPGIGPLLIDAILARDLHVVIGTVLLSGLLMILGNLIADALLLASDPRIRR